MEAEKIEKTNDESLEQGESPRFAVESYQQACVSRRKLGDDEVKLIEENEEYVNEKKIQIRDKDERKPMSKFKRTITAWCSCCAKSSDDDTKTDSLDADEERQYTLTTTRKIKGGLLQSLLGCLGLYENEYGGKKVSERFLVHYLHWTFNASFFVLFSSFFFMFIVLVFIFAGFIELAGQLKPSCITPNATTGTFADNFALSWMTFSTVGYGNVYPTLASQIPQQDICAFITFVTSMESFVGVLYGGFCGAIIFGKVLRILSQAQVLFTDPLLIKYGEAARGVTKSSVEDDENDIPCPILEFRIYNRDYDKVGSEIINASLSCLVIKTVEAGDSISKKRSTKKSNKEVDFKDINYSFSKLELEKNEHPFLKRLLIAKHVINEHSPILRDWAKDMVKSNNGKWPQELNSPEGIKKSIKFDQLVVNLTGTSNFSAADVYAQKIYDDFDLSIGYEFVNIIYKNSATNRFMLDLNMINDVVMQTGGGGEKLVD